MIRIRAGFDPDSRTFPPPRTAPFDASEFPTGVPLTTLLRGVQFRPHVPVTGTGQYRPVVDVGHQVGPFDSGCCDSTAVTNHNNHYEAVGRLPEGFGVLVQDVEQVRLVVGGVQRLQDVTLVAGRRGLIGKERSLYRWQDGEPRESPQRARGR